MWLIFYAPVVKVSRRVSLFSGRLGSAGWGWGCRPWFLTNQILRCCHKKEGEGIFLMAVTGEGQCR